MPQIYGIFFNYLHTVPEAFGGGVVKPVIVKFIFV
jgi:hypothetical protein